MIIYEARIKSVNLPSLFQAILDWKSQHPTFTITEIKIYDHMSPLAVIYCFEGEEDE